MGTDVVAVSNNHVMALSNSGSVGDWIMQPGIYDLDHCLEWFPQDKIGELADYEPIQFCSCFTFPSGCAPNQIDAAIADNTSTAIEPTAIIGNATPAGGYGTPKSSTIAPAVGMNVKKYGRTTEQTTGQITSINAAIGVQYDFFNCALFTGQLVVTPGTFSAPGDSGSLIVVDGGPDDRRPVGLLFAGSSSSTIANPIDEVLAAFPGLAVDGE